MNINSPSSTPDPAIAIRPQVHGLHGEDLVDRALEDGADKRGNRSTRGDGWTPERIRTFLVTLADCGCVTSSCRAVGLSVRSAYNLRNRAAGRAFHIAWEAALQIAKRRLADALMARAMHGCVDQIRKDGEVVAERCRFDNRLSMATLTRLDQRAAASDAEAEVVRIVTEEFDDFVDLASTGSDGAEFIAARRAVDAGKMEPPDPFDNYQGPRITGPVIDISDLDPATREGWTEDQQDRARRSGLLDLEELIGPQAWDTAWPSEIPEQLAPLIARNLCFPYAGSRHHVWVRFGNAEPPKSDPESNGNDELREL